MRHSVRRCKERGCQLPVLEYSDHNLAEQIIDMNAQTVMVADELRRYSDNYDIFSVRMESFGLEIAMRLPPLTLLTMRFRFDPSKAPRLSRNVLRSTRQPAV